MNRRHDIDALRALAFALVIVYHLGMYYVAGWHWHLKRVVRGKRLFQAIWLFRRSAPVQALSC